MSRPAILLLTGLAALVASTSANACTESLFRVGKGVSYREYQAPIPGNILMVARTETERLVAEWLSHTGHNVQIVEDPVRLSTHLKSGKFDVLLAHYSDRATIDAQEATAKSRVKYLPLEDGSAADQQSARSQYRQTVAGNASPRELLKAIHKTLKSDSNVKVGY